MRRAKPVLWFSFLGSLSRLLKNGISTKIWHKWFSLFVFDLCLRLRNEDTINNDFRQRSWLTIHLRIEYCIILPTQVGITNYVLDRYHSHRYHLYQQYRRRASWRSFKFNLASKSGDGNGLKSIIIKQVSINRRYTLHKTRLFFWHQNIFLSYL